MQSEPRRHTAAVRLARAATLVLGLHAPAAMAAPAPWYVWISRIDGRPFCTQSDPGPGWTRSRGPYRDSQCHMPHETQPRPPGARPPALDAGQPSIISPGTPRTSD